jgi:hypothetical protein
MTFAEVCAHASFLFFGFRAAHKGIRFAFLFHGMCILFFLTTYIVIPILSINEKSSDCMLLKSSVLGLGVNHVWFHGFLIMIHATYLGKQTSRFIFFLLAALSALMMQVSSWVIVGIATYIFGGGLCAAEQPFMFAVYIADFVVGLAMIVATNVSITDVRQMIHRLENPELDAVV